VLRGLVMAALPVQAQDYPTRPVRLIVPFAAGGSADVFGRFIAQRLQDAWVRASWSTTGRAPGR
jgi:tripartite-type tricarboxylate transporter receptor subunit TctC